MSTPRPFTGGILAPVPCFFDDEEELDCGKAGVKPVVSGSMGEAIHLTHSERIDLIHAARSALDAAGLSSIPIIAGAGSSSTRETIEIAKEAAEAGADQVIVVPPGYYAGALAREALKQYFIDVANGSPIPVMLYNFPSVAGGIDMDSDLIEDIAKSAPNTCGIKLTCGSVGKITRIASLTGSPGFGQLYPRKNNAAPFLVIDGFIDILYPSISVGASGAITGVPNFAPRVCMKLWELCLASQSNPTSTILNEAQDLQVLVSKADWAATKAGIPGMKSLLNALFGYGHLPRRPLLPVSQGSSKALIGQEAIEQILQEERKLELEAVQEPSA
ncbi:putative dihydrodipicolinate synthase [Gymnopus androsaceus JB14]|uniref:Dihydrodipicolinate synthase n=1 Tax=Gymnopus androsaceus JB14 TaxID=1447944 RepID=A0A6A4I2A1_9AGAR|nr:putative dihydrodipicolinate synthase [Gymnopus androsaceus JB14]